MKERKPKNIFVNGAVSSSFIGDRIQKHNSQTGIGGHSIVVSQVRENMIGDQTVTAIEYTAFEEMTLEKMHDRREAIFEKYTLTCMHVYHSLGIVAAGEISLFIFTSAPH